jgi:Family of unknown function (DUF6012)
MGHAEPLVTHHVHYKVLDHDFDTASDSMVLWYACEAELGGWSRRLPAWAEGIPPVTAEPLMEIIPRNTPR